MSKRIARRPNRTAGRPPLPRGPITLADLAGLGWSEAAVRHAVAVGDLNRLTRGVFVRPAATEGSPWARRQAEFARTADAAALRCPRAVVSHFAAALRFGIPTYGSLGRPCLTVPSGTALRDLADVHLHRATLTADDITSADGVMVTTPARTVLDLAREHGVPAGLIAADYVLHEKLARADELAAAFEQCRTWPGRKAARIVLASAHSAAESPLETMSRLRMSQHRLPSPRLQVDICDEYGRFLGRGDFYWEQFGVVGEADGNLKYAAGSDAIVAERRRQQAFEDAGLIVVRWGWAELATFERVVRRLEQAFARGARPGSSSRRWGVLL